MLMMLQTIRTKAIQDKGETVPKIVPLILQVPEATQTKVMDAWQDKDAAEIGDMLNTAVDNGGG